MTGFSPATGHAEPGWGVEMPWESACELGIQFKQDAIYVVIGGELYVTFCDTRRSLVHVGPFPERTHIFREGKTGTLIGTDQH
jgi:hypothetical protein